MDEASHTNDRAKGARERFRPLAEGALAHFAWPWLLLCLVPVAAVVVADLCGAEWFYGKPLHETVSVPILAVAAAAWLGRAWRGRSAFMALVSAQAFIFMLREIHFAGTSKGVYVATAVVGLLVLRLGWRMDWSAAARRIDWAMVSALGATFAAYAVALLIQRRVFRMVPGEERLHVAFEEVCETWAHLCLLASAFVRGMAKGDKD